MIRLTIKIEIIKRIDVMRRQFVIVIHRVHNQRFDELNISVLNREYTYSNMASVEISNLLNVNPQLELMENGKVSFE